MKTLHFVSGYINKQLLGQILAFLIFVISLGWLIVAPGFEPVLAVLGSFAALISLNYQERKKEKREALADECDFLVQHQIEHFDLANHEREMGQGHENLRKDYQHYFGGREDKLKELDDWLVQTEKPFGLLVAPAGMGKTALVDNWARRLEESEQVFVIYHSISLRYDTNNLKEVLHSLLEQMARIDEQERGTSSANHQMNRLDKLDKSFNREDLKEICFGLGVDYDNLGVGSKRNLFLELLLLCEQNNRVDELANLCKSKQSNYDWLGILSRPVLSRPVYERPLPQSNERNLSQQLRENLRHATGWSKPLVVIIDGLDELDYQLNQPGIRQISFFPNTVGGGIHILVTARGESLEVRKAWQNALGWEDSSLLQPFTLGALSRKGVEDLLCPRLVATSDPLAPELIDRIFELSESGDPLTARLWLDRLLEEPKQEADVLLRILAEEKPGTNGYIDGIIRQIKPVMSDTAMPLFELLSLARGPLGVTDIAALGIKIDARQLKKLVGLSGRLIIEPAKEVFVFSHSRIGQGVQDQQYLSEERRSYWLESFHRYGKCALRQAKSMPEGGMPKIPLYLLDHYAEHLQLDQPNGYETSLYQLVDEAWMKAHYQFYASHSGFLDDVERAWQVAVKIGQQEIQNNNRISTIGIQVKCGLVAASMAAIAANLPPALPALLVQNKPWHLSSAIRYTNLIPDTLQRIRSRLSLLKLFPLNSNLDKHVTVIASNVLADLAEFTDSNDTELRARLLLISFPFLTEDYQVKNVIAQAGSLQSIAWRVRLWGHLVKRLPTKKEQVELASELFRLGATINFSGGWGDPHVASEGMKPYILDAVALNLPSGILKEAMKVAFHRDDIAEDSYERSNLVQQKTQWLLMLAKHIPKHLSEEFLQVCVEEEDMYRYNIIDHVPSIITYLAPQLSPNGVLAAYQYLINKIEQRKNGESNLPARDRPYTQSYFATLIILAYFCPDKNIKKQINQVLEEKFLPLETEPDDRWWGWGLGITRYQTILALYQVVFMGLTDEDLAEQIRSGTVKINEDRDDPLFCLLGSQSMKAVIEQLYAQHVITGIHGGREIRTSPYYLTEVAKRLPDEDLDLIMKIAGDDHLDYQDYKKGQYWDMELWGRLRAMTHVAHRLSPAQRQDYALVAINQLYSAFDSSLEALKRFASILSPELAESLIDENTNKDWQKWLRLEQISGLINNESCQIVQQKLYKDFLNNPYKLESAQSLVILSAQLDSDQVQKVWDSVLAKASFIADLPTRIEIVKGFSKRATSKSKHWRLVLNRQIREEALALATSVYPRRVLSHLPFRYRLWLLYRLRREIAFLSGSGFGYGHILKVAIIESNHLRQIGWFIHLFAITVVFQFGFIDYWPIRIRMRMGEAFESLQEWVGEVPLNKLMLWVAQKWLQRNKEDNTSYGVYGEFVDRDFYKTFLDSSIADLKSLHDKSEEKQHEAWQKLYSFLWSLGYKPHDQLSVSERVNLSLARQSDRTLKGIVNIERYHFLTRRYGSEIWHQFPHELYDLALQAAMMEKYDDYEQRNNLLALLPGIAIYRRDLLPTWREGINRFWRATQKATLLVALGNYLPEQEQEKLIKAALNLSSRGEDSSEADWICGFVLQEAIQYLPDAHLPFMARSFVEYHHADSLSDKWLTAIELMAQRIGSKLDLLETLWPLITQLRGSTFDSFVEAVAPNLDRNHVVKFLVLATSLETQAKSFPSSAYINLRTRWRELTKEEMYDIWCQYLHEISSLSRVDFLNSLSWFSSIVEDLGGKEQVEQVGDNILEIGRWQWL